MRFDGAEFDLPLVDQVMDHMPNLAAHRPTDDRPLAQFSEHPRHPDSWPPAWICISSPSSEPPLSTVTVRVSIGAKTATVCDPMGAQYPLEGAGKRCPQFDTSAAGYPVEATTEGASRATTSLERRAGTSSFHTQQGPHRRGTASDNADRPGPASREKPR